MDYYMEFILCNSKHYRNFMLVKDNNTNQNQFVLKIYIKAKIIIAIMSQFIINKIILCMSYYLHKPSLSQDTNRKLIMIRKNLLHDVLVYNQQSSQHRRQQKKNYHSREISEMNNIISQEHENIKRQDEEKRLNAIQRKQMLREEYERQIKQKFERKQRQKQHDKVYAQIEKDYLDFSSQRRIYDIERMFNRRSYKASINQNGGYNRYGGGMESNRNSQNRLKSEPSINYNPELGYPYGKDYGYYFRNGTRDNQRQRIRTQNDNEEAVNGFDQLGNKNSLNNIQIKNPTQKIGPSSEKRTPAVNEANNFSFNSKPRQGISKNLDQDY